MLIGKKGYNSLKVILFFAFSKRESFSMKEISSRIDISEKVLEQVLLFLKNKKLLSSKRGPQGGYRLSKDVFDLTMMDILKLSGENLEILPVPINEKSEVIDKVFMSMEKEIKEDIVGKFKDTKVRDLLGLMIGEVTESGLNYMI